MNNEIISDLVNNKVFPGVSYAQNGTTVSTLYSGYADAEKSILVDADTIFHACSITKLVTSLLIMKLYEKNIIDIDENVDTYLKRWKIQYEISSDEKVTVRHLLSHTSGIIDGENSFYGYRSSMDWISVEDIIAGNSFYNTRKAMVTSKPGSTFEYSDLGYCILQMMIEDVLNMPYEEALKEMIFTPLNMEHSFIATKENIEVYQGKYVLANGFNEEGLPIEDKNILCPDLAASGLWATPSDLVKLGESLYASLCKDTGILEKKTAIILASPAFGFSWTGLGIFRDNDNLLVSRGWGEDAQCMMRIFLDTGLVEVIMGNKDPGKEQKETFGW